MISRPAIVTLLVANMVALSPAAQKILLQTYTLQDGMVANPVKKIYQDSKGFIWIATWEGLSKYDGHRFTNFTEANGLSSNLVNDVQETAGGKLWVAANNGIVDVIRNNSVLHKAAYRGLTINNFLVTKKKRILAGTDSLGIYELKNDSLQKLTVLQPGLSVSNLSEWRDSLLVGGDENIIALVNSSTLATPIVSNHHSVISFLYEDESGRLWLGTNRGLRIMTAANSPDLQLPPAQFNIPVLKNSKITAMEEDALGNYWFGTSSAGIVVIERNGQWRHYTEKEGLPSRQVNCFLRDRENNMWIGTSHGLAKFVATNNIRLFDRDDDEQVHHPLQLQGANANTIIITDEAGQLRFFDTATAKYSPVIFRKDGTTCSLVKGSNSWVLLSGKNGKCTVAAYDYNRRRLVGQFKLPDRTYVVIRGKQQTVFAGTHFGLFAVEDNGKRSTKLLPGRIHDLLADSKGYIWAGTWEEGLYRIDYNSLTPVIRNFSHLLHGRQVRTLFEDRDAHVWVGTRYNGLVRLQQQTSNDYTAKHWDYRQGLMTNWISSIAEDAGGNIWLGSYLGLDKLVKQDSGYRIFNFSRINNFFAAISAVLPGAGNNIWLATNSGLVHMNDEHTEHMPPGAVYITTVAFGNDGQAPAAGKPTLSHRQNKAFFEFAAPGFINEKQILYSYRLPGSKDSAWSKASASNSITYESLPPGDYRFEVKVLGWNGAWGKPAVFSFRIQPPYWKTPWFLTAASLGLAALLYLFFRYRIRQLVKRQKERSTLQQLQNDQLNSQLEMERVINFFTISLANKNTREEVIWDVAKNLIHKLGFENCMIYLWNEDKSALLQKAGYGPNGSLEQVKKAPFTVKLGQGIVGYAAATKKPVIVADTSKDPRYRADELVRYSEISVPALHNGELVAVIDSEDFQKDYYTAQHLQILNTIAALMAAKLATIEASDDIRKKKEEIMLMNEQMAQLELASLRSQMNPHFIFNSLNSIHKYIWENKQENASEYLTKFSRLIRMILENSKEKTIPLSVEIEMLHLYIELEHRRCNGKFNYRITVADSVKTADISVPSMFIQPYAENAIWHGLVQKQATGDLAISITGDAEMLECRIEDNGIGREKGMEIKKLKQDVHKSLGLDITAKRLDLLQRETGQKVTVSIIDKKDDNGIACGTLVVLQIPVLKTD